MKTYEQFSTETDEHEYKIIRKFITEFMEDDGDRWSYTSFTRGFHKSDFVGDLKKLKNRLKLNGYNLNNFFNKYRDKIYNDEKFTCCCGFMDALLYEYDNNYLLSGIEMFIDDSEVLLKYNYGYQDWDMGRKYLLQAFDTLMDFYTNVAESLATQIIKDDNYKLVKNDDICLLLTGRNNLMDIHLNEYLHNKEYIYDGNIFIVFVGGFNSVLSLKYNIINHQKNSDDDLEEFIPNYSLLIKDIQYQEDVKKYNL